MGDGNRAQKRYTGKTLNHQRAAFSLLIALLSGCASVDLGTPDAARGAALSPSLFPMTARSTEYQMTRGERRTLRLAITGADAATLWIEGGRVAQRLEITQSGVGISFSGEPGAATELIRFGALPGATWSSGQTNVLFDGWERIEVPAGVFDVARVKTSLVTNGIRHDETWWFADAVGIVRLRSDYGGLFTDEMSLAGR